MLSYNVLPTSLAWLICSGANVYAEDQNWCTPVLIAAANKNIKAFRYLMKFMDLQDDQKNPVFRTLHVKLHQAEILQVRCQYNRILTNLYFIHHAINPTSFSLLTSCGELNLLNPLITARTVSCILLHGRMTYQSCKSWWRNKLRVTSKILTGKPQCI